MSWLSRLINRNRPEARPVKAPPPPPPPNAHILVDRVKYVVTDLGTKAFRAAPYDGGLIARQQFLFRFVLDIDGNVTEFPCQGLVVKIDGEGLLARYTAPNPLYQRALIECITRRHVPSQS